MSENDSTTDSGFVSWLIKSTSWVAAATALATIAVTIGSVQFLFTSSSTQESRWQLTQAELRSEIQTAMKSNFDEIEKIKNQINALSNPPSEGNVSIILSEMTERVSDLEKTISTIETAIVDSPERAMSIPILRRDLDSLRTDVRSDLVGTKQEIDRVYDLSKWFIGLMATMAIGILGLAVGNLFKSK